MVSLLLMTGIICFAKLSMVSRNQKLNNPKPTVDASEEVRIVLTFLEAIYRFKAHSYLNLYLFLFLRIFILHKNYNQIYLFVFNILFKYNEKLSLGKILTPYLFILTLILYNYAVLLTCKQKIY